MMHYAFIYCAVDDLRFSLFIPKGDTLRAHTCMNKKPTGNQFKMWISLRFAHLKTSNEHGLGPWYNPLVV